ncbi:MAG: LpxI family protein [Opitutales bacterium]
MSNYLPDDFSQKPIGLIAGKGDYPRITAERILEGGLPLRLIAFRDETAPELLSLVDSADRRQIKVGQLGKMLKSLQEMGCAYALMAGQITPKRLFRGLHPDLKALSILNRLEIKNAETIFGAIAAEIEKTGIQMLDARAFIDDQLAHRGLMTGGRQKAAAGYLSHGIRIAKAISEEDIGQGCVVRKGTVLAVEAYEGTDPMLERAGSFQTDGKIFVKTVKRAQDYRFDVPVFGQRTLDLMHSSKISTAALQAGSVIMLDKASLIQKAKALKIELIGY